MSFISLGFCESNPVFRKLVQFCSIIDTRSASGSPLHSYLDRVESLVQQGVCNSSNILFFGLLQSELGLDTKISYTGDDQSNQVQAKKIIDLIKPFMGQIRAIIEESDPCYFPHFMTQEKVDKDHEIDPSAFKRLKGLEPLPLSTLISRRNLMHGQKIFIDGQEASARYSTPNQFYDLEDLCLLEEVDFVRRDESGLESVAPPALEIQGIDLDFDREWCSISPEEACDVETNMEKWEGNPIFWKFMNHCVQSGDDLIKQVEELINKPTDSYDSNDLKFCKKISDELDLEKDNFGIQFIKPPIYRGNIAAARKVVDILEALIKDAKAMRAYLASEEAR